MLTATKELSNVTPGKQPTDPLALNDLVQYAVTIVNGGNATAYDVNIVDTLPIELALHGDYTPTAAINGTPVAGFVGVPPARRTARSCGAAATAISASTCLPEDSSS